MGIVCFYFLCVCVCVGGINGGGGGGGGVCDLLYLRSICSFPFFSFSLFLGDGLILDGNSQRAVKSKTTYQQFWGNNSKITKFSGMIL